MRARFCLQTNLILSRAKEVVRQNDNNLSISRLELDANKPSCLGKVAARN